MELKERNIELNALKEQFGENNINDLINYSLLYYNYEILKIIDELKDESVKRIKSLELELQEIKIMLNSK